jgi:homocysteine S-methyltransferase
MRPIVAASIGPYGAFMADGSEYTGRYDLDEGGLYDFHRGRWAILARSQADLLACETIPNEREATVLLRLLRETPGRWAWLSFCCRDERHLSDGSRLRDAAQACDEEPRVAAVGINCTAPDLIPSLLDEARRETEKPILVYPNSGERYDAAEKSWHSAPSSTDPKEAAVDWARRGAVGIGGCCRVGPETITEIRHGLLG